MTGIGKSGLRPAILDRAIHPFPAMSRGMSGCTSPIFRGWSFGIVLCADGSAGPENPPFVCRAGRSSQKWRSQIV